MLRILLFFIQLLFTPSSFADTQLTVDDYAKLAENSLMTLSPDGSLYAYRKVTDLRDVVIVRDFAKHSVVAAVDVSAVKPDAITLVNNQFLILHASENKRISGYRGRYDVSAAFACNLKTNKIWQLMRQGYGIAIGQTKLGVLKGYSDDGRYAYMPAYADDGRYNLYRVSLEKRRKPRIKVRGTHDTVDFFLRHGEGVVRERYNNKTNIHRVELRKDGSWQTIFSEETAIVKRDFVGLNEDHSQLIFTAHNDQTGYTAFYTMSIESGEVSASLFDQPNKSVENVLTTEHHVVLGVGYSGFTPSYHFFSEKLNARMRGITKVLPNNSFTIVSYTPDWSHILFHMEGELTSGSYVKYYAGGLYFVENLRPDISGEKVLPVTAYSFKARDGMDIPSLLTLPRGAEPRSKNLPAIMLPHGGPEAYDRIQFDYFAQYFANKGFAVIQPQFRGSSGFGFTHTKAGWGEWGRKMQDDLTDAVTDLIAKGTIDKHKVCIVGASYGGYAALAGAVFTPDLYKCVVAINGVADIPRMLARDRREYGRHHWVISYWDKVIKKGELDHAQLRAISPVNHAAAVKSPVLLIHGEYDEVVSIKQSKVMLDALEDENKQVTFIELEKGDHYLSTRVNRAMALTAIDSFIDKHIKL